VTDTGVSRCIGHEVSCIPLFHRHAAVYFCAGTETAYLTYGGTCMTGGRGNDRWHRSWFRALATLLAWGWVFCAPGTISAHHSYAIFDGSGTRTVSGVVAKLDWKNPHVFVWVYVPSEQNPGTYVLWAFENDNPAVLAANGWNGSVLKSGDKITVEYWPLRDGRPGGHWERGSLPDGRVLTSLSGPKRVGR